MDSNPLLFSTSTYFSAGVDVAESVVISALGGGGGNVRDLVLIAPGVPFELSAVFVVSNFHLAMSFSGFFE